ncbi:MAG: hypothetical protein N2322_04895, partial [Terrimicrobiaceae bacterium]|nr:hypothetical protein [Terrimicrobiaceae bacterium]
MSSPSGAVQDIPARFRTSPGTLFVDRAMTVLIKLGGVLVITTVLGIFVFIAAQVFPLFREARVSEAGAIQLPQVRYAALGMDEWGRMPLLVEPDGRMLVVDIEARRTSEIEVKYPGEAAPRVTAASW